MKKTIIALVALMISVSFSSNLHAKKYNMVFWYPGEEGSTAEAEPVLQSFFDYLNTKLKGETFTGKYFNATESGRAYIRNSKPQYGVVSWIALTENFSTLPPAKVIAQTKPYPDGLTTDQFTLVGHAEPGKEWQAPGNILIYSSVPISVGLLKSKMMPDFQQNYALQTTNTILLTLKKIASGENPNHTALLTPMEKYTLDNIKADWKKNLTTVYTCKAVPTAQLIYFGEEPAATADLLKVISDMPNDPKGKEILESLRLKGFKPAG